MRKNVSSGAPWEKVVGYSRAVRIGNVIEVSGTAPVRDGKVVGETGYEQAKACLEIIEASINEAGGQMKDVVRTRMFVTDISLWEQFGKAHGEFFKDIMPATAMVEVSKLIDDQMLIEIEATAVVPE